MNNLKKAVACLTGASVLSMALASCTHNPATNEKAFSSFNECIAGNVLLAALTFGGTRAVTKKVTGSTGTANTVAAATGGAVLYQAWQQCAAIYQEVRYSEEVPRDVLLKTNRAAAAVTGPSLQITEFSVTATVPGEPIRAVARYAVLSSHAGKIDIPVVERRIISWPDEGEIKKIDALSRVVAKQGSRKADAKIDTPAELVANSRVPFKYRFEVEAEGLRAAEEVQFFFDGKQYVGVTPKVTADPALDRTGTSKDVSGARGLQNGQRKGEKPVPARRQPRAPQPVRAGDGTPR